MTNMQNDPGRRGTRVVDRAGNNMMAWVLGALAAIAVLGLVFWAINNNDTTTATGTGATNTGTATQTDRTPGTGGGTAPSQPATPSR
ncbi:MAG TPA: hypothetical protein VHG27_08735 [Xanthobacteraceae bacterium]|nr:hypothetical protein [Xanthobacteraceae bacterium]